MDHRADLFALGAILYELLSGRRAFSRDTAPETMAAILNEDPPDLSAAAAAVPPALVRIVSRCLEKNPSERFQTASDLAFALESLSDASGVSQPTPAGQTSGPHERGSAGPPLRCCWRRWRPSRISTSASGLPRPARCASRFPRSSNSRGREISACLRTAVTWRSRGAARMGSRGSGSGPWIHWKSGLFPVPRHRRHAASFLVSRRTVRRVRRRREAQEAGCVGRSAANLVRSAAWECRRGRLVES